MTSITPEQELLKEKDKASLRQRFMTNVLRGAAVVFVPFAAQVPAVG
jgi:peptidase E